MSQNDARQMRRARLVAGGLVLVTLIVFAPALGDGFVNYDDLSYVSENPRVAAGLTSQSVAWAFTATHAANWHPLTWLSLELDSELWGYRTPGLEKSSDLQPRGFHLTNVLLHAANSALLFYVFFGLTGVLWPSALTAALFALHPSHVESVAWISERKDVLSTLFGFLALLAYAGYVKRPSVWRYGLVAGFLALGLMSKPMLVTWPFVLLLLDYWPLGRLSVNGKIDSRALRRLVLEKVPMLFLSAASCVITFLAQREGAAVRSFAVVPLATRLENSVMAYARYMAKALWPTNLSAFYPLPLEGSKIVAAVASLAMVVVLSLLAINQRWRRPYLVTGWFWYLGTLIPVLGFVQVGLQSMADRYTYIPLIGLFIVVAWASYEIAERRGIVPAVTAVACCILIAGAVRTRAQVDVWRDSVSLWRNAVRNTEKNWVAHSNLGDALFKAGEPAAARREFQAALAINPRDVVACGNLARLLLEEGRWRDASAVLAQGVRAAPERTDFHRLLAWSLSKLGESSRSHAEYETALAQDPRWPGLIASQAWLLATKESPRSVDGRHAVELAEQASQAAEGGDPRLLDILAAAYAQAGDFDRAIATANTAAGQAKAAGSPDLARIIEGRIALYRSHKPFHQWSDQAPRRP
jgi:Flp pilus assembly protein TadD